FYIITVSCTFILLFNSFNSIEEVREILRRKIENRHNNTLSIGDELIYSIYSLPKFYEKRIYLPAWSNPDNIEQLIFSLKSSVKEGLNPEDYHFESIVRLFGNFNKLNNSQKAELDLIATDAFLLYTSHLLSGKVNPESIDPEWYVSRREGDPVELLKSALNKNAVKQAVQESIPRHNVYQGLKKALSKYDKIFQQGGWKSIPEGETLKKGMENERIKLIRDRLIASEDLPGNNSANPNLFDEILLKAIKRFQENCGLYPDGEIGNSTIAAMNISAESRINQIKVNLERWRWLPKEYSNYYIKVNIANYTLEIFKNGKKERIHKAIVGKDYRRTPVFSSKITYLVLNPTWTVPPGILNADVLPAVRKNVNYLKTKNLTVYDRDGNPVDLSTVDWYSQTVKTYTYRQPPGPDNALGAVKFMFPNKFNVYIHDTPSKELFNKSERSLSSGCVRVQDPLEMAEFLLNDSDNWNLDRIKKYILTKKSLTIQLKEQPFVHILYWTAWTNDAGVVQFRKDIYERDGAVIKSINSDPPTL
ncbi:murein L,D-transpeptidase, partial [candidate division KSB1 bacterium]